MMSASPTPKPIDETLNTFPPKRDFPNNLKAFLKEDTSHKDLFELAWKIVQECGEEERHFNQLQSVYRGLVSTWLLATFAAIGYLFKELQPKPYVDLMCAVVSLASTWGIRLIWVLDLEVYHQLLVAVFKEGQKVENSFAWLPGFRTNMYYTGRTNQQSKDPVFRKLSWYYAGTILFPIVGGMVFSGLAWRDGFHWTSELLLGSLLGLAADAAWRFYQTTKKKEQAQ